MNPDRGGLAEIDRAGSNWADLGAGVSEPGHNPTRSSESAVWADRCNHLVRRPCGIQGGLVLDRFVILGVNEKAGVVTELVVEFQGYARADPFDPEVPVVEGIGESRPRRSQGQGPDGLRYAILELVV